MSWGESADPRAELTRWLGAVQPHRIVRARHRGCAEPATTARGAADRACMHAAEPWREAPVPRTRASGQAPWRTAGMGVVDRLGDKTTLLRWEPPCREPRGAATGHGGERAVMDRRGAPLLGEAPPMHHVERDVAGHALGHLIDGGSGHRCRQRRRAGSECNARVRHCRLHAAPVASPGQRCTRTRCGADAATASTPRQRPVAALRDSRADRSTFRSAGRRRRCAQTSSGCPAKVATASRNVATIGRASSLRQTR